MIYTIGLLWLALTGSFWGWGQPTALLINAILAIFAVLWWIWELYHKRGEKPLTPYLVALWLVFVLTSVQSFERSLVRLYYYLVLIAVYHLPVDMPQLRRGAWFAGWLFFPIAFVLPENTNSIAMAIWSLLFLADYDGEQRWLIPAYWGAGGIALAWTHSEGGMLAALVGAAYILYKSDFALAERFGPLFSRAGIFGLVGVAGITTVSAKIGHYGTFGVRLDIWRDVLTHISVFGHGADTFYFLGANGWDTYDQHNVVMMVLWSAGIVGVVAIGWLLVKIQKLIFEPWAVAWLFVFAGHSMVDNPLIIAFLPATVLMIVLGAGNERDYIDSRNDNRRNIC